MSIWDHLKSILGRQPTGKDVAGIRKEAREATRHAAQLPEIQREVLMDFVAGFPVKTIARNRAMTVEQVMDVIRQATNRIIERLEQK